jgi:TrmH family RNA methyltransferase
MPISSGTIKFISSLRQKKVRRSYRKFVVEGPRMVAELLAQQRYGTEEVYGLADAGAELTLPPGVAFTEVSERELGRMSQLTTPHRVLAVASLPAGETGVPDDLADHWSLYLDGVQSPSNLGAILRIADWFGFPYVFGGAGTADLYNPKSLQASMGSFLRVDYRKVELADLVDRFPELAIYGADLEGESIYEFTPPTTGILVVGAEGAGIRARTQVQVSGKLHIPRAPGRDAESLNVAVATGILCSRIADGHRMS